MIAMHENRCLPDHVWCFGGPDVWMEGEALSQLADAAAQEGCVRAVGMPDLHPGGGIPLGAAFAFEDRILPALIGSDAGCGVRLVATSAKVSSMDKLERRVRWMLQNENPFAEANPDTLLDAAWTAGPRSLAEIDGVPEAMRQLAAVEIDSSPAVPRPDGDELRSGQGRSLATTGGGNNFMEVARVTRVTLPDVAASLSLDLGTVVVLVHSGSRGIGASFADRWRDSLTGGRAEQYMTELAGICNVARANRFALTYQMLVALGAARVSKQLHAFDLVHNSVNRAELDGIEVWLHRKGAAPALSGEPTVVLGTRGNHSWVMLGAGNPDGLWSVAHGAGRKMGRSEAAGKLRRKYSRQSLARTRIGGRVICDETQLLYEEHPDAYKNTDAVVRALTEAGLAQPVVALEPMLTVKQ